MKHTVPISYSKDCFTIESEEIAELFGLPVVRLLVRDQKISLTPHDAWQLGKVLIQASQGR